MDLLNYIRLDHIFIAISCIWTGFVMFSFLKLVMRIGSEIMRGYFIVFGAFLIAISAYLLVPNVHTLLIATFVSIIGAVLAAYMYRYIYRYHKKNSSTVLPVAFKDLAIFNFLAETTQISKKQAVKNRLTEKFSNKETIKVSYNEMAMQRKNVPFNLDKDGLVVAEFMDYKFAGLYNKTVAEAGGKIGTHWHDCDEICEVISGDVTVNIYMGNRLFKVLEYVAGDVFPLNAGTEHEVVTVSGYELNINFIPPNL